MLYQKRAATCGSKQCPRLRLNTAAPIRWALGRHSTDDKSRTFVKEPESKRIDSSLAVNVKRSCIRFGAIPEWNKRIFYMRWTRILGIFMISLMFLYLLTQPKYISWQSIGLTWKVMGLSNGDSFFLTFEWNWYSRKAHLHLLLFIGGNWAPQSTVLSSTASGRRAGHYNNNLIKYNFAVWERVIERHGKH